MKIARYAANIMVTYTGQELAFLGNPPKVSMELKDNQIYIYPDARGYKIWEEKNSGKTTYTHRNAFPFDTLPSVWGLWASETIDSTVVDHGHHKALRIPPPKRNIAVGEKEGDTMARARAARSEKTAQERINARYPTQERPVFESPKKFTGATAKSMPEAHGSTTSPLPKIVTATPVVPIRQEAKVEAEKAPPTANKQNMRDLQTLVNNLNDAREAFGADQISFGIDKEGYVEATIMATFGRRKTA